VLLDRGGGFGSDRPFYWGPEMSGICGIVNLDGRPVAPETLAAMMEAMDYWGPDGSGVWRAGPVGLGHLMLYNTPESLGEKLPLKHAELDLVITAQARLDNREELFGALDIPSHEQPAMPDSSLILRAYEKWGDDCPHRLLGDWCFAIWDARSQKLFLARDHAGNTGLFYHYNDSSFIFACSLKGLLALPETSRRLNELRLAQVMVFWNPDGAATCYEGIFRLPPAHALTVRPHGMRVWQYWFLENSSQLSLSSDQEYLEAFRNLYDQAVLCRLRSHRPVGIALSGGLDSGSTAALAARELRNKNQVLLAFSSVPSYSMPDGFVPGRFTDETPFIEAISRQAGNIENTYILATDVSPLVGIKKGLKIHDEPAEWSAMNYYWLVALLSKAQTRGIGVLLTGQGGNATVSWSGWGYLANLARRGRWSALRRELLALKARRQRPLWRLLAGQVVKPLLAPYWSYRYRLFKFLQEPWTGYSPINADFARRLSLLDLMFQRGHDPTRTSKIDSLKERFNILEPGSSNIGGLWHELGAAFGLEVRDPTMDKRLLEFCLAIPDDQYFKNGLDRRLIRLAMKGILSDRVLNNTRRGQQAADIGWRMLDSWQEVSQALDQVENSLAARQYLDTKRMRVAWDSLKTAINWGNTAQAGLILLQGLITGLFILSGDTKKILDM
jgi:asparagine synthase (glutamine-hydrolysing)